MSNTKKIVAKALYLVSPTFRKLVQQDQKIHALSRRNVKLQSSIDTLVKQTHELSVILDAVARSTQGTENALKLYSSDAEALRNIVDASSEKVDGLQKKFVNTLYNKASYFEIDGELGIFTVGMFRKFLAENKDDIPALVEKLKASLDEESCAAVDLFLERIQFLLPEKLPGNSPVLYRKDDLFTEAEQEPYRSGKVQARAKAFREKYQIGGNKTFLCPIFYESGLTFLSEEVLKTISGSVVIDCGAYWGDTAIVFSEYNPAKVYAFEPVEYWHKEMTRIVELNGLSDVIIPTKKGISAGQGKLSLTEGDTTSFLSEGDGENQVEVVSLDHFLEPVDERVGLIKIDVEGLDFDALLGAEETIKRDKPILLTSIYHTPEHFFGIRDYIDGLNLGYKHKIRKLAKSPLCDLMLISWAE